MKRKARMAETFAQLLLCLLQYNAFVIHMYVQPNDFLLMKFYQLTKE